MPAADKPDRHVESHSVWVLSTASARRIFARGPGDEVLFPGAFAYHLTLSMTNIRSFKLSQNILRAPLGDRLFIIAEDLLENVFGVRSKSGRQPQRVICHVFEPERATRDLERAY